MRLVGGRVISKPWIGWEGIYVVWRAPCGSFHGVTVGQTAVCVQSDPDCAVRVFGVESHRVNRAGPYCTPCIVDRYFRTPSISSYIPYDRNERFEFSFPSEPQLNQNLVFEFQLRHYLQSCNAGNTRSVIRPALAPANKQQHTRSYHRRRSDWCTWSRRHTSVLMGSTT